MANGHQIAITRRIDGGSQEVGCSTVLFSEDSLPAASGLSSQTGFVKPNGFVSQTVY